MNNYRETFITGTFTSANTFRLHVGFYQLRQMVGCDCDISGANEIAQFSFKCILIHQERVESQIRYWSKPMFYYRNIKYRNYFYLPFSRSEAWLDWSFAESFLRSKKSWITFSKASIFSFESKFSANEFSKSPTNLVTLKWK